MRAVATSLLGAVACSALIGCGGRELPLPPKPTTINLTMHEYRFEHDHRQRISQGRIVFRVRNAGRESHQLILFHIPDELAGSLADQLRSKKRQGVVPLAILSGRRPAQRGSFAIDLPRGRYGIVCFLKARGGEPHAVRGMNAELQVEES